MAAAVHSNVGLMHATMAIFNAWCDRMPMLILGATGPVDAVKRRPWIDWIHTARDQGALVRDYTKWDDQPASPGAAREALLRAALDREHRAVGPIYVNLDAGCRRRSSPSRCRRSMPRATCRRSRRPRRPTLVARGGGAAAAAKQPVILVGRVRAARTPGRRASRSPRRSMRASSPISRSARRFPTDHPLHVGAPRDLHRRTAARRLRDADVILSLDWVDLGGTLRHARPPRRPRRSSRSRSTTASTTAGAWTTRALPPVDLFLSADPDAVVPELLKALDVAGGRARRRARARLWAIASPPEVHDMHAELIPSSAAAAERDRPQACAARRRARLAGHVKGLELGNDGIGIGGE